MKHEKVTDEREKQLRTINGLLGFLVTLMLIVVVMLIAIVRTLGATLW